jgi:hypothetical protein
MWKNNHGPKSLIRYNNKPKISGRTSPPGKISPANAPPCSSTESLWLQTTMGEGGIKGGAMGEGGIKGGAVNCPNTPEHTSRQQTSNSDVEGASRGAGNTQGEDEGNNANAAHEHCQREPMHNGRDRGGGNMTRDVGGQGWMTTMDNEQQRRIYVTIN